MQKLILAAILCFTSSPTSMQNGCSAAEVYKGPEKVVCPGGGEPSSGCTAPCELAFYNGWMQDVSAMATIKCLAEDAIAKAHAARDKYTLDCFNNVPGACASMTRLGNYITQQEQVVADMDADMAGPLASLNAAYRLCALNCCDN